MSNLIPNQRIQDKIYLIRGHKVMIDHDLAGLYRVETKYLKRQVKRNIERFPADFMFQLSTQELENWRCQIVTSNSGLKMGLRYRPYAFTENGVAMLSSVLNSKRAIQVNIQIVRVFTKFRELMSTHKDLAYKLKELERKIQRHDVEISSIYEAIQKLMAPSKKKKRKIGF